MGTYAFDPIDPKQRQDARKLLDMLDAKDVASRPGNRTNNAEHRVADSEMQRIRQLLATESGQLIYGGAAQLFPPNTAFTLEQLANQIDGSKFKGARKRVSPGDVLAWWRRLGGRQRRLGGGLFQRHEGKPITFSLDPSTHQAILVEIKPKL